MAEKTFYDILQERQADTRKYKGKLILKKKDINWHVSPQGRNAAVVDLTSGIEAKTFGMVLTEIPPGGQSGLHKHTFEAAAYVLEGDGYELIGDERIDWETGDFFYMPPNINHRHVNKSQDKPAKLLQVEAWPLMIYLGISEMIQQEVAGRAPLTKVGE
jgi:quercetin dioxygenase-like cupin family protein